MAQQFGKFQLLKKIATGGMAEIHLAKQRGMEGFEKLVVIKMILPHLANNQEFVQMFLDEARIAARLTHPNIVQIYDLGRAGGTFFIAMEYIQGENLRTIAKTCRKAGSTMPLEHIVKIISQACEGLHYAHSKTDTSGQPLGLVHRDISPQNILVSFDGVVKLVDFGIAKAAVQVQETRSGVLKGKYAYMSPEQCLGRHVDGRSDIFAMGIVLWELATGTRLYKLSSELMILKEITEGKITPPREVNQTVPAELEAIILKALEKNPDHRFQDALQMHLALEEFMKSEGLASSTVHLAAFMRKLFKDRLDGLRKLEEAQQAGDSLESFLFDDIPGGEDSGSAAHTPSQVSPISSGSQPLYPKATTGVSRVGTLPSGPPTEVAPPPAERRVSKTMLTVVVLLMLLALGGVGYLVYEQVLRGPESPPVTDAGTVVTAPHRGSIHVTSTPPEATIRLNGNDKGSTPVEIKDLEVGIFYTLEVSKNGFRPWTTQFKLEETGEDRPFNARLEALVSAAAGWGWVEVVTNPPGASVELDGKAIEGLTPLTINQVAANDSHTVKATIKGRQPWSSTFKLKPNERLSINGALPVAEVRPPSSHQAVYSLHSKPAGAKFFLDDEPVSTDSVTLEPGRSYEISAKLAGYSDWSDKFKPALGERRTVTAKLTRSNGVSTPIGQGKAMLSVQCTPWAEVYLDGEKVGQTPLVNHEIAAGPHEIRLLNSALDISKTVRLEAKAGEQIKRVVEFEKGFLNVIAKPWAHVIVGGRKIGTTPFDKQEFYEGTYTVVLENPTLGRTIEKKVTIKAGETAVVTADFLQ